MKEGSVVNMALGLYSQHFIFFVTYEWTKKARMLHYAGLESLARDKYSSLLGPFVSYEENDVLWKFLLGLYSQNFFFFVTY